MSWPWTWTCYVTALVRTLNGRQISLTGVTEAPLVGGGSSAVERATVLHSGGCHHVNGVALVMCGLLAECLTKWLPVSDRLLLTRFSVCHGHLSVVVAYALTEDSTDEVKDVFYGQLEATISNIRPHDTLLLLGDLNATTGTDCSGFKSVVGRFDSGDIEPNDNSMRVLSLCSSAGLAIMESWFQRRDVHR